MGQSPDGSTYSDEPSDYILVQGNADLKDGWVVPRVWTSQKTKTAQAGDLIMSVRAPVGAMGKTAYDIVIGRGVAAIKGNKFIYQTLVKYDADGYWKKLAAGSTFESVNSNEVKGAIINVPQDIEEQKKIGEYFLNLDHLITLHQQKLTLLTKLKKAMLEKMFPKKGSVIPEIRFNGFANAWEQRKLPKKGSVIPEIRFNGFANAWEQRKLGEVVERFDNLRIPVTSSKRERGITPYYGANGIQDYVQGYTHDGEFVLVAEDGANDLQNYPIHYVNGKVWVNNHAHVLQGKKDIADNLFLVNAIKRIKFETYLVGGSRAKLNADVMMKLPIKVPTLNEQQKLGKYFSRIDSLIALHQRKIDKLKNLKKAMLDQMFI